jgi:Cof subfamily protein (haloacid dehalogenase superfamily)
MKTNAIIFDLDGTAVDSPQVKLPTNELIQEIQRLNNKFYLSTATGRAWSFAKNVIKALNLTDPCIISAGTQICNPQTGEILSQKNISPRSLSQIVSILKNYPEYKIIFNDASEDDYFNGGVYPQEFKTNENVYFFEQAFVPNSIAIEVCNKLEQVDDIAVVLVVSQKPGCNDIHIINKHATKEHAVEELLKLIKVKKENTIGIGDGNNDIHLFNAVGYKVAMGNGVESIKSSADKIIESVSDNGLAKYFATL